MSVNYMYGYADAPFLIRFFMIDNYAFVIYY